MKPNFSGTTSPFRRQLDAATFLGVRAICSYMHIGPSTFYTWIKRYGFPATHTPDGRWMTTAVLIDDWVRNRLESEREQETGK